MKDRVKELEKNLLLSKGQERIGVLNQLSKEIGKTDPKRALEISEEAYVLSEELRYKYGMAQSLLMKGYACRILSKYNEGMSCLFTSLQYFEDIEEKEGMVRVFNLLGINYFYFGAYELALEYFMKSLNLVKVISNTNLHACILNNIGEIYREIGRNNEALNYYQRSLRIIEPVNDKQSLGGILLNIGLINYKLGNVELALEYYQNSYSIFNSISDRIYMACNLNRIGEIYQSLEKNKLAKEYYMRSLNIFHEQGNRFYQIEVLMNLGKASRDEKLYNKSFEYFERALLMAEEVNAKKMILNLHLNLSELYEETEEFNKGLFHYKMYHNIEKEVVTEDLEKKIELMKIEFEIEKAKNEAEIYRLKNVELKAKSEELEKKAGELEKAKEELERMEKSRQHLLTNISHDLRTPITSVQGYVEAMLDGLIVNNDDRNKYLRRILSRILILRRLIEDLFQLSKLESRQFNFDYSEIKISKLIENIYIKYELDVKNSGRNLIIEKNSDEDVFVNIDIDRIDQVFGNLIFNALKYTSKSDIISIGYERLNKDEILIIVNDNGIGISEEDIPYIFDRFYKGSKSRNSSIKGNGLGLSIAKEIIESHGGKIWVESSRKIGSHFKFILPISLTF